MMDDYLIWEDRQIPLIAEPNDPSSEPRLEALMATRPAIVAVRGISGFADLQHVSSRLAVQEAVHDLPDGHVKLWAVMGETPHSLRAMATQWPRLHRLSGLVFAPEKLLTTMQIGVDTPIEEWPDALRMGRNMTVLMSLELDIPAYEWTVSGLDLAAANERSLRDGFRGDVTLKTRA